MATINKYKAVNSWSKGMNKDLDISVLPKESYLHAENFRLVVDNDSSTTSLESVIGNSTQLNDQSVSTNILPSGSVIVSHCIIRDILVLFVIQNTMQSIYRCTVSNGGKLTDLRLVVSDQGKTKKFNFSVDRPIKALGRYESDDVIKVYWTDNYSGIRFINIVDPDVSSYTIDKFDIIPSFTQNTISIDSIGQGVLDVGMVQYSYQLYNLYGAETNFILPSPLVGLSSSSSTGSDYQFKGNDQGEKSGKSVSIMIQNIDTSFDRIRIVRIHHFSLLDPPKINIITEMSTSSTVTFTDNGSENLGELTLEEFSFINYDFVCKDLETKNNILFAANIKESNWDVDYDARAYRFGPTGITGIFDENLENVTYFSYANLLSGASVIPETHACRDPYNTSNDWSNNVHQGNGVTLGGEGINISYGFFTDHELIDNTLLNPVVETNNSFNASTNGVIKESLRLSFHRDEIYSLGIVFINNKGQRSYVKWIGDIRTPSIKDYPLIYDNGKYGVQMGILVEVKHYPVGAVAFQIVRCERTAEDRTILAQGLVGATRQYNSFNTAFTTLTSVPQYHGVTSGVTFNKRLVEFISPEVTFNKTLNYTGGDYLDVIGIGTLARKFVKVGTDTTKFVNNLNYLFYQAKVVLAINKINNISYRESGNTNILALKVVEPLVTLPTSEEVSPEAAVIGTTTYENFAREWKATSLTKSPSGNHGTAAIIQLAADLPTVSQTNTGSFYVCNYRSPKYPYKGPSYAARQQREYIACSSISKFGGEANIAWAWGDTFISKFEYQRTTVSATPETDGFKEWLSEVFIFPVETSIDTRWRSGSTFTQEVTDVGASMKNLNAVLKQEKAGVYSKDGGVRNYTQDKDLYSYNSVYSKPNNIIKHIIKPLDLSDNKVFDSRIIASDVKINNEQSDSWTRFKLNEFIDVDSRYGPITNLYTYNSNLLFWQNKGFGMLSVNQQSVLQDASIGGQLVLGTGGILTRYDYISNSIGNISQFGTVQGKNGLYWYDTYNATIYRYNGQEVNPLSKIKGVQSLINSFTNKTTECLGVYDDKYSECIFTLRNKLATPGATTIEQTISFNEALDVFATTYSFLPKWYIKAFDGSYYSLNSNRNYPYLHNSGNKSTFYGNTFSSIIKFAVNDNYSETKVFDTIEYKSRSYNDTVNIFSDTFNGLKVYTEKQYTGNIGLDSTNTTKREGGFSTIIPRNIVNSNITNNLDIFNSSNHDYFRKFKERIRDNYCIIELRYSNSNNYRFNIPYVITNYRVSSR